MGRSNLIGIYNDRVPKFDSIENVALTETSNIIVTEDLQGDKIDLLIDQENNYAGIRVNGKASGDRYRNWAKIIRRDFDLEHIKSHSPIPMAIIRMIGIPVHDWIKMYAVNVYNKERDRVSYISWEMLQNFSVITQISTIPEIYKGPARSELIKRLMDQEFMGIPRNGLFIITQDPVKYVTVSKNPLIETPNNPIKPKSKDLSLAKNLANEFSKLVVDYVDIINFKNKAHGKDVVFDIIWEKARENRLATDYIQRCQEEAGLTYEEGESLCVDTLKSRVESLMFGIGIK